MRHHYPAFRALGAEVLAICFDPPERAARYAREQVLPFPLLVDRARQVYRAYGLEREAWWRFLQPALWLSSLRLLAAGRRARRPEADPFQLGGDFVVDPAGRLALAHPARHPLDRPTVYALLAACGRTPTGTPPG